MASTPLLTGTETESAAFTVRSPYRATLYARAVPAGRTVSLEARPADDASAPWIATEVFFAVPGIEGLEASEGLAYRLVASAAGPVVSLVTRRATGVSVL